jgi:hypothetical protein
MPQKDVGFHLIEDTKCYAKWKINHSNISKAQGS